MLGRAKTNAYKERATLLLYQLHCATVTSPTQRRAFWYKLLRFNIVYRLLDLLIRPVYTPLVGQHMPRLR